MKKFLGSFWFTLLMCLVMGGVTALAVVMLKPTGAEIDNYQLKMAMQIAAWAAGPVMFVVSLILIGILNLIRRIVRLRRVPLLHPIIIIIGLGVWFVFAWVITDEPLYTDFARGAIEFVARPMLWGSMVAILLTILLSIPLLIPSKKKK
jgi:hypothetical protein